MHKFQSFLRKDENLNSGDMTLSRHSAPKGKNPSAAKLASSQKASWNCNTPSPPAGVRLTHRTVACKARPNYLQEGDSPSESLTVGKCASTREETADGEEIAM